MITATTALQEAAVAPNRSPIVRVEAAWEKTTDGTIDFFELDSSTLDGTDVLKGADTTLANMSIYDYTDESDQVIGLEIERSFNEPVASFSRAVADIIFNNVDDRFSPDGGSAIADYIKVNRPFRIGIGLDYGTEEILQRFIGVNWQNPKINRRAKTASFQALDLAYTVWNTRIEQTAIFINTSVSDILETLLVNAGFIADQLDFDPSEQVIAFAYFEADMLLGDAVAELCQADLGVFYFDEKGIGRYRSRDWYARDVPSTSFPITDAMVVKEQDLEPTNIINHVEVKARPRALQNNQIVWKLGTTLEIAPGDTLTYFINYDDPVTSVTQPSAAGATSYFYANTDPNDNGIDYSSSITINSWTNFGKASKVVFENTGSRYAYITDMVIYALPAKALDKQIIVRAFDQTSIDENGEYKLTIENDFIQSALQARNLANILLGDRKDPASYREMTIIGQPHLQLGDQVLRDGIVYNIIRIFDKLSASEGYLQDLKLVSRTIQTYFRLDISQLNGNDTLSI